MGIVDITLKDGTTYTLENIPDDMTDAQIMALAEKQRGKERAENYGGEKPGVLTELAGGMKHAFDKAAYGLSDMLPDMPISKESRDAYNGHPLVRTLGLTLPGRKERVETLKDGSEFVKNTGAASTVGELAGDVIPYVAGGLATGPAKLLGLGTQALIGGVVQPGDVGDKLLNAGFSAAGEGVGQLLGGAAKYGIKGVEPFTQSGRAKILRRTLEGAATDPANLLTKLDNAQEFLPGVRPTTAQAAMDPGISQLADAAGSGYSQVASAFQKARTNRLNAYDEALQTLGGLDQGGSLVRKYAEHLRKTAADADYAKAYSTPMTRTPELDAMRDQLLTRPSVKDAVKGAKDLMAEKGMKPSPDGHGSVQGLGFVRDTVYDKANKLFREGDTTLGQAVADTRNQLTNYLEQAAPLVKQADANYAANSLPLNQMDIGEALYKKSFPAINDAASNPFRITPNAYSAALRDGDNLAVQATGLDTASMNMLSPTQRQYYKGIQNDMTRAVEADELAKMAGSPTAQRTAGIKSLEGQNSHLQNMLRGFGFMKAGPFGAAAADELVDPLFGKSMMATGDMLAYALSDPKNAASVIRNTSLEPGMLQNLFVSPKGAWSAATTRLNPPSMQNLEEQ